WVLDNYTTFYYFALAHFITVRIDLTDLVAERIFTAWRTFRYIDRTVRCDRDRTLRMVLRGLVFDHHVLIRYNRLTAQLIVVRYLRCVLRFRRIVRGTVVFLRNQWVLDNYTTCYQFVLTSFLA